MTYTIEEAREIAEVVPDNYITQTFTSKPTVVSTVIAARWRRETDNILRAPTGRSCVERCAT